MNEVLPNPIISPYETYYQQAISDFLASGDWKIYIKTDALLILKKSANKNPTSIKIK